jgi:hypothetical protein
VGVADGAGLAPVFDAGLEIDAWLDPVVLVVSCGPSRPPRFWMREGRDGRAGSVGRLGSGMGSAGRVGTVTGDGTLGAVVGGAGVTGVTGVP